MIMYKNAVSGSLHLHVQQSQRVSLTRVVSSLTPPDKEVGGLGGSLKRHPAPPTHNSRVIVWQKKSRKLHFLKAILIFRFPTFFFGFGMLFVYELWIKIN